MARGLLLFKTNRIASFWPEVEIGLINQLLMQMRKLERGQEMVILAKLLCLLGIGFCIALLIKPVILKGHCSYILEGEHFYFEGIGKLIGGIIFLLAAPQAKISWFVVLFGLMGLSKGILIILLFTFKPEIIKSMYKWWMDKSEAFFRLMAMIAIVLCLVLLASL